MQEYNKVNLTDLVKDAILKLDSTTQSLASSFSGTAFPTNNLSVGMPFFNTNNNCFYMCTALPEGDQATWTVMGQVGITPGKDDKGQVISSVYSTKDEVKTLKEEIAELKTLVEEAKQASYPRIGDIICTKNTANPSAQYPGTTWQLLSSDTFLMSTTTAANIDKTGGANTHTITTAQMPSHNHSVSCGGAGGHNHTRGSMNITGTFYAVYNGNATTGAFSSTKGGHTKAQTDSDGQKITLNAANAWTGNTSWCDNHTHSISVGWNGSGQAYDSRPKYISVYMWIRTA